MDVNSLSLWLGITGSIASLVGLLIAWIQTVRFNRLREEEKADVWLTIRHLKNIFVQLERGELEKRDVNAARAYEAALSLFRIQLKRAVLFEKKYDLSVIDKWKNVGKISTEWQERQALNFLTTEAIGDGVADQYKNRKPRGA